MFDVKYAGYLTRQTEAIERQKRLAKKKIPENFDYDALTHLRMEAKEKFNRFRPVSLEQASRISGITPAVMTMPIPASIASRGRAKLAGSVWS